MTAQVCEKQKNAEDSPKSDVEEVEIDKKIENGDIKEDVENGKDDEVDDNEGKWTVYSILFCFWQFFLSTHFIEFIIFL